MYPMDQYGNPYPPFPPTDAMGRPIGMGYPGTPGQPNGPQTGAQRPQRGGFICIPVTSREEAVATRVEAFGPAVIMPDLGHGMIYYKRFNEKTALADFGEFRYVPPQQDAQAQAAAPQVDYAGIVSGFTGRLDGITQQLNQVLQRLEAPEPEKPDGKGAAKK